MIIRNGQVIVGNEYAPSTEYGTATIVSETRKIKCPAVFDKAHNAGDRIYLTLGSTGYTYISIKRVNTVTGDIPFFVGTDTNTSKGFIKVGGQYAGEGFWNANEMHEFVYDGSYWHDLTATVIYKGSNSKGNYIKHRDGKIEQWKILDHTASRTDTNFPIPFSNTDFIIVVMEGGNENDDSGFDYTPSESYVYRTTSSARFSTPTGSGRRSYLHLIGF